MRIRRPRGITSTQFIVITALGIIGGVYIWKPLILKYKKETQEKTNIAIPTEGTK